MLHHPFQTIAECTAAAAVAAANFREGRVTVTAGLSVTSVWENS